MNENTRTFLKGYAQSKARVKNLIKALADHTAVSDDLRAAAQEAKISSDLADAIEAAEENMVAFKEQICAEEHRIKAVIAALSAIDDQEARLVLEYHYLSGMTLREISEERCYCLTTIKQLHRRGLDAVEQYLLAHDN